MSNKEDVEKLVRYLNGEASGYKVSFDDEVIELNEKSKFVITLNQLIASNEEMKKQVHDLKYYTLEMDKKNSEMEKDLKEINKVLFGAYYQDLQSIEKIKQAHKIAAKCKGK